MHVVKRLLSLIGLLLILSVSFIQQGSDARIAYLKANAYGTTLLWRINPYNPDNAEQLSPAHHDILAYDVSPDGRMIVYAMYDEAANASELVLLDVQEKSTRQLTNCALERADCLSPKFNPLDARIIAYERTPLGDGFAAEGDEAATQVWMLDIADGGAVTASLFADEWLNNTGPASGYGVTWGGSRIAFYNGSSGNILIYDFSATNTDDELLVIPGKFGVAGAISPDGSHLIFPELVTDGTQTRAFLQIANLNNGTLQLVTQPDDGTDDQTMVWSPDGRYVVLGRRYTDYRYTQGPQVYLFDLSDWSIRPLVVDKRYSHGFFDWDDDGTHLIMQRFQLTDDYDQMINQGKPEIWLYNLDTGEIVHIVDDGRNPMWLDG